VTGDHRSFWHGAKRLPGEIDPATPPAVPAILVKKGREFPPFWHRHTAFVAVIEKLYLPRAREEQRRSLMRGFGSFSLRFRRPCLAGNPKTGEAVSLAGTHTPDSSRASSCATVSMWPRALDRGSCTRLRILPSSSHPPPGPPRSN
jgi:hypothetical protein